MIYKATNNINGKIYIGQTTKQLDERKRAHLRKDDSVYFHKAIRKYGIENFSWEIIDNCCNTENSIKEKYYIKLFNSTDRKIGYNTTEGGDGGDTFTHNPNKKRISEKRSKTFKKLWKEDDYRKHMETQRSKLKNNKEFISKVSSNSKKMWEDIKRRKEHSDKIKKIWKKDKKRFMKNRQSRVGENNPMAKTYIVTDANGIIYETKNLKKLCKDNNISYYVILDFLNKGPIPLPLKKNGKEKLKLANWQISDKI